METLLRPFPQKTRKGDLYFDELDNRDQKIVLKHLKISGKINDFFEIRNWLLKQMQEKKCIKKNHGTLFVPSDSVTKYYYNNYMLTGKKMSFLFPHMFRINMENVFRKEMDTTHFNYEEIYIDNEKIPDDFRFNKFNENEWILSDGAEMSPEDEDIMEKYKTGFINFLNRCVQRLNKYELDYQKRCAKEVNRIEKLMDKFK